MGRTRAPRAPQHAFIPQRGAAVHAGIANIIVIVKK